MIECNEFAGKVITSLTIFEDGSYGPELVIKFTDGTVFSVCVTNQVNIEATHTIDGGGQPQVLKDYSTPANPR
jgi:hypothetical protein